MESLSPTSSVAEVAAAIGALLSNSPDEAARADRIIREQCCDGQVVFLVKDEPEEFVAQLQLTSFGSKIKVKAALKMLGGTVGPSNPSEAPKASPESSRQLSSAAERSQGDRPPQPASQDFAKCTAQEQPSPMVLPTPSPVLASGEGEDLCKLSPVPLALASPIPPAAGPDVERDVERNSNAGPIQEDIQTDLGANAFSSLTTDAAAMETSQQKLSDVKPEPMEIDAPIGPVIPPATNYSEGAGSADSPAQTAVASAQVKAEAGAEAPEVKPESAEAPKPKAQASTPRQMFKQTIDGAKQALETMKALLMQKGKSLAATNRVKAWMDAADDLLKQTAVPSTRIGVIGDTGAGKSSLINAALGEENILPTNGMRACTATVIRLEYNNANRLYEGEVHFVERDELYAEVELLLADAKEDGTSIKVGSRLKNDSAKELAIAKLVSIWGKDIIQRPNLTADYLLGLPGVTSVLGTVKHIRNAKAKDFSKEMNKYVDSTPSNEMTGGAFWPLVKEACIRYAWPLLESGAIIVDLPGVRDANAARAKVAEGYLKKCNTIWVAANICRAVDDGTAKNLLGDNFRRQLLMDGQYGKLAFICTKVDDINTGETINTLGVKRICEDNDVSEEEFDKLTRDIDELEDKKYTAETLNKKHQERLERYKEQIERWTTVRDDLSEELELDHGVPNETERSLPQDLVAALEAAEAAEAAGEANSGEGDEGEQSDAEEEGASDDEDEDWMPASKRARVDPELPTHDEAFLPGGAGKLQAKRRKLNLKLRKLHLNLQLSTKVVRDTDAEINVILGPLTKLTKRLKYLCVIARNKYSTHELKEDFKAGLEEMQELAGNSGALQAQDLDLPVFCISSKEAQTFSRTARRSGSAQVFSNVEDTGLPGLRSYLHEITGKQQVAGAKRMATALTGYFAGICTYLSDDGTLDGEVREQIRELCERHTGRLDAQLKEKLAVSSGKLQAMFTTDEIQPQLHAGVEDAVNRAVSTARKWGNSARAENPGDRGLHWATYKAAVRPGRFGIYTSRTAGQIDMNEALAKPIHNKVSVAWDTVMNSRAKDHLLEYQTEVLGSLADFCKELRKVLLGLGVEEQRILRVESTAEVDYTEKLETKIEEVLKFMEEQQRDISRALNPEIQERMKDAYIGCTEERGSGSFARMKAIMEKHVESERQTMFDDASKRMLAALEDLAAQIRNMTARITEGLTKTLQQHYGCFWDDPVLDLAGRNAAATDLSVICKQADTVCAVAGVAPQPWHLAPRKAPEPKPRVVAKPKAEPSSTATSKYAAWSLARPEDFDDDEESDEGEESDEDNDRYCKCSSPEMSDDEDDDEEEEEENNHSLRPTCYVDFCMECNECHHCQGYDCDGNDYEDAELNEDEDEGDEEDEEEDELN